MWIKTVKKNERTGKLKYTYYRLMQSIRTPSGVKHRAILNLGKLKIPKGKQKDLANRIEEITLGQKNVFTPIDKDIELLAIHYGKIIIDENLILKTITDKNESQPTDKPEYQTVDITSMKNTSSRTIGGEHIAMSAFKTLKLDTLLRKLGLNQTQIYLTAAMITGRLLSPSNERSTKE